jgi:predicted ribosomally synthesized peptide with SipW-like signal peptide
MKGKNSRSQKKLAILPIMIAAMLISTGVAYAYWYDTLTIHGEIKTATFDVELSNTNDYYDCEWKDVVTADDVTMIYGETTGPDKFDSIIVTINGAYPSYHGAIRVGIVGRGIVPAHMKGDPIIDAPPELNVWLDDEYIGQTTEQICGGPYVDPFPDCWQLHLDEEFFWIHFHVIEDDDAVPPILPEQGKTYSFKITFPVIQYNYDTDCDYSDWAPGP